MYKAYSWDGSDYTEISNEWKGSCNVPILSLNPDQTPVYQGLNINTIIDYRTTLLAVGKYVAIEKDGSMIWYGIVTSNYYDYASRIYVYNVDSYFEKLKSDTPTELSVYMQITLSTPDIIEINTDLPAGYLDGNGLWVADTMTYYEITIKGFLKAIIESSAFLNMTAVFDLDTNITTVLESLKISHLNLASWKSKYSDYELEYNLYNMLDILSIILKIFGLRMYISDTGEITVTGSDTAPTIDTFDNDYIFNYTRSEKSAEKFKRMYLKQKELLIRDDIDPESPEYYFSVGVIFSYNRVLDMIDSGSDIELTFALDHKLPTSNNTMFSKLKMLGYNEGVIDQNGEQWAISDTNKIKLLGMQLTDMRYSQTNIGNNYMITTTTIIAYYSGYALSKITTSTDHDLDINQYNISVSGIYGYETFTNGQYTYEAGTGTPTVGKYRIQADNTIWIYKRTYLTSYSFTKIITDYGNVSEVLGTSGTPKYIQYTRRTTMSGNNVIAIYYSSAGHGVVNTDKYSIIGTSEINDDYTYMSGTSLISGEYYIYSSTIIYIKDDGQSLESYCDLRVFNEDYEVIKQLTTQGREDTETSLYDYLTIYKPSYSIAGDWKEDWKTVSLQDTTNTLLLNATLYSPWWFYYFSPYYQTVFSESIEVEDTETPDITKAKKITYNIEDQSISIDQDDI